MKKAFQRLYFPVIVFLVVCSISCNKIKDKLLEDPTADYKPCNIKSIHFYYPSESVATFYYNELGDPDSVKLSTTNTGNPNVKFRYDSYHRLTDFISYFNSGNLFLRWTHYKYDNNSAKRSTSFTTYNNGYLTDAAEPTLYLGFYKDTIKYDAEGRVVQLYPYDANGNLALPGYSYDDKVNPRRTNKIFMFVDNNYSRNNPVAAESYNKYGFPTKFGDNTKYVNNFLDRSLVNATITYMCD